MNLFTLSWSNLKDKPLTSGLSLILLTMGVTIISLLLLLSFQLDQNFSKNIRGIDMVVGAKGSPLQLILSAVYHIDSPTGNIPLKEAERLAKHPLIKRSIPLAYGDSYQGYRIVGTDTSYVSHYGGGLEEGRLWEHSMEVTAGALAAKKLGLKVGDTFFSAHGLDASSDHIHEDEHFKIVGILAESGSVLDQLLLTEVSSLWNVHADHSKDDENTAEAEDHDHAEHEGHEDHEAEEEDSDKQITAMLISFRSPMGLITLPRIVNQNTSMQAALPAFEINRLYSNMGVGIQLLQTIALAIIILSGISVFISLYNSLKARRYELALMRSMGASQGKIFALILLEGLILSFIGGLAGLVLSRLGMWKLSTMMASDYHYPFSIFQVLPEEIWLFAGTIVIGFLAAIFPALNASNTDIHRTLAEG